MPMPAKFIPADADKWYYDIPHPHTRDSAFYATFIEPFSPPTDRSHGRYLLPFSPRENLIRDNTKYTVWDKRVFLNDEESDWIFYQVWEDKAAAKRKNRQADIIYCHGINDYGGKFADHAPYFLEAGYRIVCPDLPSHGRSTGLHSYVTSMESLAKAVDAVICDVALCDRNKGATDEELDSRKRFIAGSSMGGFTALFYTVQYPPEPISEAAESAGIRSSKDGRYRPRVDGALLLCPMLEISPESRPSLLVEYIARALSKIAGRWPLAEANKGKNSEDPTAEQEFERDPQGYCGKLRIATGLSILQGILNMNSRIAEVNLPFKVFHGTSDRVTNPKGSQRLFDGCSSKDKEIQLYEGCEHVLLRKGHDEKDDEKRQRVLKDMLEWLEKRS